MVKVIYHYFLFREYNRKLYHESKIKNKIFITAVILYSCVKYNICIHTSCVLCACTNNIYMKMFEANDSMISMASILIIYISLYICIRVLNQHFTPHQYVSTIIKQIYISQHIIAII